MDSSVAWLVTVLGTVAAAGVGLVTWLSVRVAQVELERDRARARGRVIAGVVGSLRRGLGELVWRGDTVRGTVPVREDE